MSRQPPFALRLVLVAMLAGPAAGVAATLLLALTWRPRDAMSVVPDTATFLLYGSFFGLILGGPIALAAGAAMHAAGRRIPTFRTVRAWASGGALAGLAAGWWLGFLPDLKGVLASVGGGVTGALLFRALLPPAAP